MPSVYLSPSTQEFNPYAGGGNEEEYMNLIADEMLPSLEANGIQVIRNIPEMTAASSITASNAGEYDLHLSLHSNASPEGQEGTQRGSLVFYYPGSANGRRAAELIAENLRRIYPLPQLVQALPTTTLGEVVRTRAPAVLIEFAYHDNPDDAAWIRNNVSAIAENVAQSLAQYFGIPFLSPARPLPALVDTEGGYLNIRSRPSLSAPVVAQAYDGAYLTVLNRWNSWYLVRFGCLTGYASSDYITLL